MSTRRQPCLMSPAHREKEKGNSPSEEGIWDLFTEEDLSQDYFMSPLRQLNPSSAAHSRPNQPISKMFFTATKELPCLHMQSTIYTHLLEEQWVTAAAKLHHTKCLQFIIFLE